MDVSKNRGGPSIIVFEVLHHMELRFGYLSLWCVDIPMAGRIKIKRRGSIHERYVGISVRSKYYGGPYYHPEDDEHVEHIQRYPLTKPAIKWQRIMSWLG